MYATKGVIDHLPIGAVGEILDKAKLIDTLDIAHDETLMLELKLSTNPESKMPFAFVPASHDGM